MAETSIKIVELSTVIMIIIVIDTSRDIRVSSSMLRCLNVMVVSFMLLSLEIFTHLLLMLTILVHVALVLFLSVLTIFFFVGHFFLILNSLFFSLVNLFELTARLFLCISLSTGQLRLVGSCFFFRCLLIMMVSRPIMKCVSLIFMINITMHRFTMHRFMVNRFVVDKSVIILVLAVDDPLKSLIISMRSRVMRAQFFMEIKSLFFDGFLFICGSLFVGGLLLSRFRRSFIAIISTRFMPIRVLVRMLVASVVVFWLPVVNWLSVVPAFLFVVVIVVVVGFGSVSSGFALLLQLAGVNNSGICQEFGH